MTTDNPTLDDFESTAPPASAERVHAAAARLSNGNKDRGLVLAFIEALDRERPLPLNPETDADIDACVTRIAAREGISYNEAFHELTRAERMGGESYTTLLRPCPVGRPVHQPAATVATTPAVTHAPQIRVVAVPIGTTSREPAPAVPLARVIQFAAGGGPEREKKLRAFFGYGKSPLTDFRTAMRRNGAEEIERSASELASHIDKFEAEFGTDRSP